MLKSNALTCSVLFCKEVNVRKIWITILVYFFGQMMIMWNAYLIAVQILLVVEQIEDIKTKEIAPLSPTIVKGSGSELVWGAFPGKESI